MPKAMITQTAIASAMKQLMKSKAFNEISIKDIIKECGVSRKTFYYHFLDKYDVVTWIFKTDIVDSVLDSTTLENWADGSLTMRVTVTWKQLPNHSYFTTLGGVISWIIF